MKYITITFLFLTPLYIKTADPMSISTKKHSWKSQSHPELPDASVDLVQHNPISRRRSRITMGTRRGHRRKPSRSFTHGENRTRCLTALPQETSPSAQKTPFPEWIATLKQLPHIHATIETHFERMSPKEKDILSHFAAFLQADENFDRIKSFSKLPTQTAHQLLTLAKHPETCKRLEQLERNPELATLTTKLNGKPIITAAITQIVQSYSEELLVYLAKHKHLPLNDEEADSPPKAHIKYIELMEQLYKTDIAPLKQSHQETKRLTEEVKNLTDGVMGYAQTVDTAGTNEWLKQMPHLINAINQLLEEVKTEKEEVCETKKELNEQLQQVMLLQKKIDQTTEWLKHQTENRAELERDISLLSAYIQAPSEDETKNPDSRKRQNSRPKPKHFFSGPLSPRSSKDKIEKTSKS